MTSLHPGVRMSRSIPFFLLCAALAAGAAGAQARWVPLGPEGGAVRAVTAAANGRTLYAGVTGGVVFKSVNRGRSWFRSSEGLRGTLLELKNAAVAPGTVYALTTEGVFASFDAARTWTARNGQAGTGLPRLPGPGVSELRGLEVAPSSPSTLYVAAPFRVGESFTPIEQVYRSLDGGATWVRATRGLPDDTRQLNQVFDLAVDPARPQVVYAANTHGVFKTTDGGGRWSSAGLAGFRMFVVEVDRVRPDLVYAVAGEEFGSNRRVFVSEDGGGNWTERGTDLEAVAIEAHPARAETAYLISFSGGLYETTDAGRTWTLLEGLGGTSVAPVRDVAADPTRPGVLFAAVEARGTDPGLFRSADGGGSWSPSAAGIVATAVTSLAFQPDNPGAVFAGLAEDGVHRLDVATGVWTQLGLDREQVAALIVDPEAPDTFYAAAGSDLAVWQSTDRAVTWELVSSDVHTTRGRTGLALVDGRLWTVGFSLDVFDPATGLWEHLPFLDNREIASAGTGPATRVWWNSTQRLDAAGGEDTLIFSPDAGATIEVTFAFPRGEILDIALDPGDLDRVAFGIGTPGLGRYRTGAVFLSDDRGATWRSTAVAPGRPVIHQVVLDPRDPQRIVAGTLGAVYESLDGGATWRPLNRGFPRGALVTELAFDELGNLYAATNGAGAFRLRDRRP